MGIMIEDVLLRLIIDINNIFPIIIQSVLPACQLVADLPRKTMLLLFDETLEDTIYQISNFWITFLQYLAISVNYTFLIKNSIEEHTSVNKQLKQLRQRWSSI
jgi:hypothetical protein